MSKVKSNIITEGLSGKISSHYTFVHNSRGKTFLRRIPVIRKERTQAQQIHCKKFAIAHQQATEALKNPIHKANFEVKKQGNNTLFGTAFKHYWALIKDTDL